MGGCWVLTSHFWHPLVSPYTLLASVDSLTSRLNREEGDWVAVGMGMCCAFFIIVGHYQ
jgi:hypothetical protein